MTTRLGRVLLLEQVLSIRVHIYRGAADVEPGLDLVLTQKPFDPNLNFCLLHMQNSAKWTQSGTGTRFWTGSTAPHVVLYTAQKPKNHKITILDLKE